MHWSRIRPAKYVGLQYIFLSRFHSSLCFVVCVFFSGKSYCIAVNGSIPWHSYRVSLAVWDHTVLPATRHKWTHPALTPAMQAGTRFTYPGGMEGWVDLVDLIAPRPGVKPATFQSRVQRSTNATTKTTHGIHPVWPLLDKHLLLLQIML